MKKDLLIMCQYFYPEYVSSSTLPTELAEDLVKKGLSVDVLCGYPNNYYNEKKIPKRERYKGINIYRVKYLKLENKIKIGRVINFFTFFINVLFRMPRLFNYKCILVYSNPPILPLIPYFVSRISKTEFIFVAFDIYPDVALKTGTIRSGSLIDRVMKKINKKVYKEASKVVALGNEMKKYMIEKGIAIKPEKVEVIPNWYDKDKVTSSNVINNNEFQKLRDGWSFIVLYSGNMGMCQDMETILQCMLKFKDNKEVLFIITGHGCKAKYVNQFINDNKITNAKVYGFLLEEDYSDILKVADICLVSLAEGIEGLGVPSKTYGYLVAGKPVLAIMSDTTDIAKNLRLYNAGASVQQGDVNGLEKLILSFLSNKEKVDICGKNARMLFDDLYDRQICTDMYYKMIMEVLEC